MTWTPAEIATIIEDTINETTSDVTNLCALIHEVAEAVTGVVAVLHATGNVIALPTTTRGLPSPLMQRLTERLTQAAAVKQAAAAEYDALDAAEAALLPDDAA